MESGGFGLGSTFRRTRFEIDLCRFHGSLTVYSLFILDRLGDDDDDVDDDVVLKVLPLPRAWPIAVACFLLILSQVS
jgi:hypothetical protein